MTVNPRPPGSVPGGPRAQSAPGPQPDREDVAGRLLRVSAKHSFDPSTDVDWHAPVDPDLFAIPAHRCSLYGTPLWEEMTPRQQAEFSTNQYCSVLVATIWAELVLMVGLVRHVYKGDPRTLHARYALTEVADECRHSSMFGRYIGQMGYPTAQVRPSARAFGTLVNAAERTTLILAGGLFVEEYLDAMQREMVRDESLQPLARAVARIHVIEESRHIGYARDELQRRCDRLSAGGRAALARRLAVLAAVVVREQVHPRVYALSGFPARAAHRTAVANPLWRATRAEWSRKAVAQLTDLGLIDAVSARLWRRASLMP